MTHQPDNASADAPAFSRHWSSRASLVAGLIGLITLATFFFTSSGPVFLWLGVVAGLVGVVLGAIALRHRRPDASAVTGIVTGAISAVLGLAIFVFALIFVGAISL
jgi:hypothetical protein